VPPFYPFERREENGTVFHYGRGTVDAKGPIATMIIASHKFFGSRSDTPRLGMLFVVGEEIGGTGMKAFASYAQNTTFRACIFGEPTEGKLASGHKGSLGLTLDIKGKSAHSAYPWLGISAINYLHSHTANSSALPRSTQDSSAAASRAMSYRNPRTPASRSAFHARKTTPYLQCATWLPACYRRSKRVPRKQTLRSVSYGRIRRILRPSWTQMLKAWRLRLCSMGRISQACRRWRRDICLGRGRLRLRTRRMRG
jgi:hypothetical protein